MLCYHITFFFWQNDANYAISRNTTSYINRKWQHLTTKWACTKLQAQSKLESLAAFRTNQIIWSLMYVPVVFKFKFCYLFAYEYKYKQFFFSNYCSGFNFGNSGILFQILPPSHKKYWFCCFAREWVTSIHWQPQL